MIASRRQATSGGISQSCAGACEDCGIVAGSTAQITLKRLRRPIGDVLRTYKVVIDGTEVGDIRRGETKTFDVSPGEHEIHLEIDWATSRRLGLKLSEGDLASLTCSARPPNSGWTALASKNYIKLEIVDGSWLAWTIRSVRSRYRRRRSIPARRTTRRWRQPGRRGRGPPSAPRELRVALQSTIRAGDDGDRARQTSGSVGARRASHAHRRIQPPEGGTTGLEDASANRLNGTDRPAGGSEVGWTLFSWNVA